MTTESGWRAIFPLAHAVEMKAAMNTPLISRRRFLESTTIVASAVLAVGSDAFAAGGVGGKINPKTGVVSGYDALLTATPVGLHGSSPASR
jgi:hypothetical protein